MQVILREEVPNLGSIGDVVRVRAGYARNYLFPRGLAVEANPRNLKALEHQKRVIEARKLQVQRKLQGLAGELSRANVVIKARAGEEGRLFGSVTSQDIQDALAAQGIAVDRKKIVLEQPIKHLGEHTVAVNLGYHTKAELRVTVVPQEEEPA